MFRTHLALALIAAMLAARPSAATTADQVCDPTLSSLTLCVVNSRQNVDPGSVLDFTPRSLKVSSRGTLDVGPGTMTIAAQALTLEPGAGLFARGRSNGQAGGRISVSTAGDVRIQASGRTTARIDVAGEGAGGVIGLAAGGDIEVAGELAVHATSGGNGGALRVTAAGSVILAIGSGIRASGGFQGTGGNVAIDAGGGVVASGPIDVSGGEGEGSITVSTDDGMTISPEASLDVSATGVFGDGGEITLAAGGSISIAGSMLGVGAGSTLEGGGQGGLAIVSAGGSLVVAGPLTFFGAPPDGDANDISLSAGLDIVQTGLIDARGKGPESSGGVVTMSAGRLLTVGPIDVSGAVFGGEVILEAEDAATLVAEVNADSERVAGTITIEAEHLTVTGSLHASSLANRLAGLVDLFACHLDVGAGARIETSGPNGVNDLVARGRLRLAAGSTLLAGTANQLEYRDPSVPPVIEPGANVAPPPNLLLRPSLRACADAPRCGNARLDPSEECDPGNSTSCDGDGCSATCNVEACGNGAVECAEQCEDDNQLDGDGCDTNCTTTGCGNGIVTALEECDDGDLASGDGCDTNCTPTRCGNGIVTPPEQCDDGPANGEPGDPCDASCQLVPPPGCGDGRLDPGEECDDRNQVNGDGCDADCTATRCGNAVVTAGEQCDDGNLVDGDGCDTNCTTTRCGNGVVTPPEQCDDGNLINGDGCDANCTTSRCGNRVIAASEECDDGNAAACDGCSEACRLERCGNGIPECAESCDDGNTASGDGCDANCTTTRCGNGVVTAGEECDDRNLASGDGCDANCTVSRCGNGIEAGLEECDDGNTTACDACSSACRREGCGNGNIECGEQCDDGPSNGRPGAACDATCRFVPLAGCGNGTLQVGAGEECDDGNNRDCDGCSALCAREGCGNNLVECTEECDDANVLSGDGCDADCTRTRCGNGVVTAREECDDRNQASGDGCDANCTITRCGNGVVTAGEQCDDGNLVDADGCDLSCRTEVPCPDGSGSFCHSCTVDTDCDPLGRCAGRACVTAACISVSPVICDDGNRGTRDLCTLDAGGAPRCEHRCLNDGGCDDGNVCTGRKRCTPSTGACVAGTPLDCDDQDICTDDSCDPGGGCVNQPVAHFPCATRHLDAIEVAVQGAGPADLTRGLRRKIEIVTVTVRAKLAAAQQSAKLRRKRRLWKVGRASLVTLEGAIGRAQIRDTIAPALGDVVVQDLLGAMDAVGGLIAASRNP